MARSCRSAWPPRQGLAHPPGRAQNSSTRGPPHLHRPAVELSKDSSLRASPENGGACMVLISSTGVNLTTYIDLPASSQESYEGVWSPSHVESSGASSRASPPRGAGLPMRMFQAKSLDFVLPGTPDSSPPFQRWVSDLDVLPSPARDGRSLRNPYSRDGWSDASMRDSVAPSGADSSRESWLPPLKRWATIGSPKRDKEWPSWHLVLERCEGFQCLSHLRSPWV